MEHELVWIQILVAEQKIYSIFSVFEEVHMGIHKRANQHKQTNSWKHIQAVRHF